MRVDNDAVETLLALWQERDPDPVDMLEDRLVQALGLVRHPELSDEEWRRLRVTVLNAADDAQ